LTTSTAKQNNCEAIFLEKLNQEKRNFFQAKKSQIILSCKQLLHKVHTKNNTENPFEDIVFVLLRQAKKSLDRREQSSYWFANSNHNQKIVDSNLVSANVLDGNGIKAIPSIPAPNSG
jgi:hypothetical protein